MIKTKERSFVRTQLDNLFLLFLCPLWVAKITRQNNEKKDMLDNRAYIIMKLCVAGDKRFLLKKRKGRSSKHSRKFW